MAKTKEQIAQARAELKTRVLEAVQDLGRYRAGVIQVWRWIVTQYPRESPSETFIKDLLLELVQEGKLERSRASAARGFRYWHR